MKQVGGGLEGLGAGVDIQGSFAAKVTFEQNYKREQGKVVEFGRFLKR